MIIMLLAKFSSAMTHGQSPSIAKLASSKVPQAQGILRTLLQGDGVVHCSFSRSNLLPMLPSRGWRMALTAILRLSFRRIEGQTHPLGQSCWPCLCTNTHVNFVLSDSQRQLQNGAAKGHRIQEIASGPAPAERLYSYLYTNSGTHCLPMVMHMTFALHSDTVCSQGLGQNKSGHISCTHHQGSPLPKDQSSLSTKTMLINTSSLRTLSRLLRPSARCL